jgi:hypothetical protein
MEKLMQNYLELSASRFQDEDVLRMDTHCHDLNSDTPDELWGRLLKAPETWLKTDDLIARLHQNGASALTITNHNNARSCWDLLNQGFDVLPGAEFSCYFPEFRIWIHVLCYGFNPAQENKLNALRSNVYLFMEYCREHELPTIMPHPLYLYHVKGVIPLEFFEKCALLFERFEVLNGQRNLRQNFLITKWLERMTPENLELWEKKHGLRQADFCLRPGLKFGTGGTDDHMGLLAGRTGTFLKPPVNSRALSASDRALDALRYGDMGVFGPIPTEANLNLAFLDYLSQLVQYFEDPGLIRLSLHKGSLKDKTGAFLTGNLLLELQKSPMVHRAFSLFHEALRGKKIPWHMTLFASARSKPYIKHINQIAGIMRQPHFSPESVQAEFDEMYHVASVQLAEALGSIFKGSKKQNQAILMDSLKNLEMPLSVRSLLNSDKKNLRQTNSPDLSNFLFPGLINGCLLASSFFSSKALFQARPVVDRFAESVGEKNPQRLLWLTDTYFDQNGVSTVLQQCYQAVRQYNLPVDFLTLDTKENSRENLHILKPIKEIQINTKDSQILRVPNVMEIKRLFEKNRYTHIICSTEYMATIGLFLKHSYNVPVSFYFHTDWMEFAKQNLELESINLSRLRRFFRFFYQSFDHIFVLNEHHQKWMQQLMGIPKDKIHLTAHWAPFLFPSIAPRQKLFSGNPNLTLYRKVKSGKRCLGFC